MNVENPEDYFALDPILEKIPLYSAYVSWPVDLAHAIVTHEKAHDDSYTRSVFSKEKIYYDSTPNQNHAYDTALYLGVMDMTQPAIVHRPDPQVPGAETFPDAMDDNWGVTLKEYFLNWTEQFVGLEDSRYRRTYGTNIMSCYAWMKESNKLAVVRKNITSTTLMLSVILDNQRPAFNVSDLAQMVSGNTDMSSKEYLKEAGYLTRNKWSALAVKALLNVFLVFPVLLFSNIDVLLSKGPGGLRFANIWMWFEAYGPQSFRDINDLIRKELLKIATGTIDIPESILRSLSANVGRLLRDVPDHEKVWFQRVFRTPPAANNILSQSMSIDPAKEKEKEDAMLVDSPQESGEGAGSPEGDDDDLTGDNRSGVPEGHQHEPMGGESGDVSDEASSGSVRPDASTPSNASLSDKPSGIPHMHDLRTRKPKDVVDAPNSTVKTRVKRKNAGNREKDKSKTDEDSSDEENIASKRRRSSPDSDGEERADPGSGIDEERDYEMDDQTGSGDRTSGGKEGQAFSGALSHLITIGEKELEAMTKEELVRILVGTDTKGQRSGEGGRSGQKPAKKKMRHFVKDSGVSRERSQSFPVDHIEGGTSESFELWSTFDTERELFDAIMLERGDLEDAISKGIIIVTRESKLGEYSGEKISTVPTVTFPDHYADPNFSLETLEAACDLDKPVQINYLDRRSANVAGVQVIEMATPREIFEESLSSDAPRVNLLSMLGNHDYYMDERMTTNRSALRTYTNFMFGIIFPIALTTKWIDNLHWSIAALAWALHFWHVDSNGFGTALRVITGTKLWILALPKDPQAFYNRSLKDWIGIRPDALLPKHVFTWYAIPLKPGYQISFPPEMLHAVLTKTPSVCRGHHFYSVYTLWISMGALIGDLMYGEGITNTEHYDTSHDMIFLIVFATTFGFRFSYPATKQESNEEHLPYLESTDGMRSFVSLLATTYIIQLLHPVYYGMHMNMQTGGRLARDVWGIEALNMIEACLDAFEDATFDGRDPDSTRLGGATGLRSLVRNWALHLLYVMERAAEYEKDTEKETDSRVPLNLLLSAVRDCRVMEFNSDPDPFPTEDSVYFTRQIRINPGFRPSTPTKFDRVRYTAITSKDAIAEYRKQIGDGRRLVDPQFKYYEINLQK